MPTVIDSLVVTLGLDATKFRAGQQQTRESLKATQDQATRVGKEMEASGKQAAMFFSQIKNEALGLIGVLVGAGSVAAFAAKATTSLAQLGREARNIGLAIPELAAFRNVIERNGGSAESATQSMKGLVDQIQRWKTFGDATVFRFLNPIGAGVDESPLAIWEKFVKFAAEHKNDVPLVNLIGQGLGFDQGLINATLQIGSLTEAQRQLREEMHRVPTAEMTENARKLQQAWFDLAHEAENVGNKVYNNLAPAFTELLKVSTDLIKANPEVATALTTIAVGLGGIAGLRFGLQAVAWALGSTVSAIGRLSVLSLPLALRGDTAPDFGTPPGGATFGNNGPVARWWGENMPWWLGGRAARQPGAPPNGVPPTGPLFGPQITGDARDRARTAREYFRAQGWNDTQIAAILGYMGGETGGTLNPAAYNPAGGGQGARGVGQWRGDRINRFAAMHGGRLPDQATFEEQIRFLQWELENTEPEAAAMLRGARSPDEAANAMRRYGRSEPHLQGQVHENILRYGRALGASATIDPGMSVRGAGGPVNNTNNNQSLHIGSVNVNTPATDARGIARDMRGAIDDSFVAQANRGLQ